MRDYKDKHWDAKYEQFRLEKERRKSLENAPEKTQSAPRRNLDLNRTGYNSYRNKIKPTKEERIFVNKGPSRFLREHSKNDEVQQNVPSVSSSPQVQVYDDSNNNSSENPVIENNVSSLKSKFSIMDILPYIFIVLGLILVILVLKGAI